MAFLEEYTLLCELGKGGFATVYKVRHNELGYIRAVRVLNDTIQNKSDKAYQNFLRECKLLLVLGNGNHRGIVHIYKPDFLDNRAVVEMDYVDGQDLLHYLAANNYFLPADEVIRMVSEMSSALAYCHVDIYKFRMDRDADGLVPDPMDGSKLLIDEATRQKLIDKYKVIHNDIHSRNIMRRENGDFVLLDFGLAIEGDEVGVSSSRRNKGVLEYISPEKWDDSSVLTTQSDIYSFGVVMYEYLTGRVPFKMEKNSYTAQTKLLEKVMGQPVPSIFEMRKAAYEAKYPDKSYTKDYPDWLEIAILKCLEKESDNRFHDGKELYDFVHDHIEEDRRSAGVNKELEKERDSLKSENEKLIKQVAEIKNNEPDDSIKTLNEELPSSSGSDLMPEKEQNEDNNGVNHTDGKKKRNLLWIGLGIGVAVVALVLAVIFLWPSNEWVDLGLPSGTLWKNTNEYGFYDYDNAVGTFGSELPTKEQMEELKNSCRWSWTGEGYKVVGPNGNSIYLPAAGRRSCDGVVSDEDSLGRYWSSTSSGSDNAWNLIFDSGTLSMYGNYRCNGRSVRLVRSLTGTLNGHDWVDLGLPSGIKWATCNVGASKPEEYGDYYAWGETSTKSTYAYNNYTYYSNQTTLLSNADVATANWGVGWRMPTMEDMNELIYNCTYQFVAQNSVNGLLFTGPNGNSIFLPAAGYRYDSSLLRDGSFCDYWSSSLNPDYPRSAWYLYFYSDNCGTGYFHGCFYGCTVRPVCSPQN